jgi:hypothetical protein
MFLFAFDNYIMVKLQKLHSAHLKTYQSHSASLKTEDVYSVNLDTEDVYSANLVTKSYSARKKINPSLTKVFTMQRNGKGMTIRCLLLPYTIKN